MTDQILTAEYQGERMERENRGLQDADNLYGEVKSIDKKLFSIRKEIGKLAKDKENPFFHSSYFDINDLLEKLQPHLEKENLLLLQPIINGEVCSIIKDLDSGEVHCSAIPLPDIQDPQKIGSAITYYRRYSLKSLLGLREEDDDANKAAGNSKKGSQKNGKPTTNDSGFPWLNATNKDGTLNKTGLGTAKKLASGKTTWKDIYKVRKVSKKDKESIDKMVKEVK